MIKLLVRISEKGARLNYDREIGWRQEHSNHRLRCFVHLFDALETAKGADEVALVDEQLLRPSYLNPSTGFVPMPPVRSYKRYCYIFKSGTIKDATTARSENAGPSDSMGAFHFLGTSSLTFDESNWLR
jgi:hypothetical protein